MSVSQQPQQQQQLTDPCDDEAPAFEVVTAVYDPTNGNFVYPYNPSLFDLVVSEAGTSVLTLIPASSPGYSNADGLNITSDDSSATKAYMGSGQMVVIFPHPPDCETHEWNLQFTAFIGTPLTVKIRKTRGSRGTGKEGSESPK